MREREWPNEVMALSGVSPGGNVDFDLLLIAKGAANGGH